MYTDKDYPEIETLETVIDYAQDTLRDYRADYTVFESKNRKMGNLNEGKKKNSKKSYMMELAEIDAQSAIVAMEAKIGKLEEMAKAKETRLEMVSEDENLSELISKSAVKEMQKEIKEIRKMQEKLKKVYEKKNGKMPEAKKMVDEDEEMNEYDSSPQMIPDEKEDGTFDMSSVGMKEEEIDEAHCNTEEDDVREETNEEVNRWQKLAGISEISTPNNPKGKDKDGKEIKSHRELDGNEYTPKEYISTLKKLGYNVDMDWYNSQKK